MKYIDMVMVNFNSTITAIESIKTTKFLSVGYERSLAAPTPQNQAGVNASGTATIFFSSESFA
jgi:hypothetical protein